MNTIRNAAGIQKSVWPEINVLINQNINKYHISQHKSKCFTDHSVNNIGILIDIYGIFLGQMILFGKIYKMVPIVFINPFKEQFGAFF